MFCHLPQVGRRVHRDRNDYGSLFGDQLDVHVLDIKVQGRLPSLGFQLILKSLLYQLFVNQNALDFKREELDDNLEVDQATLWQG